jgi:hypothetical protein
VADRFPLPQDALIQLGELEAAIERNDVPEARAIWSRMLTSRYAINLAVAATAVATLQALKIDPGTQRRRFQLPEWADMFTSVPVELLSWEQMLVRFGPGDPRKKQRRPRTRDPLVEIEKRMKAIRRKVTLRKSLPKQGAAARRAKEGTAFKRKQAQRARKRPDKEIRALRKLLREQPRASAKALWRQVTGAGIASEWRGFSDLVARLRKSRRP